MPERLVWFGVRQNLWLTGAFLMLLLNAAYLAASASPTLFYFANVAFHTALGVVALCLGLTYLRGRGWRLPPVLTPGLALLALGALSGLAITVVGATQPYRWVLVIHIGCSVAGAVPVFAWLVTRMARRSPVAAVAMALVMGGAAVSAGTMRFRHEDTRRAAHRIENPRIVPTSMEEEGAGVASPFFPSSSDTNVGGIIPADFFLTSEGCGRCHVDVYEQWNSSVHHFSSFNNQWYRKSIEYMQDVVGTRPSKWCAGCHDHAVFFNGRFDRPIKEQMDTPEAQAGLACTSCHAITQVGSTMGQGHFVIEYPPLHDLAVSDHPVLRAVHDWLLKVDPQPHRETFLKPFHREQTAEFCSTCHKVHLDVPVNAYRWFRGFNDYDNWQASGVSGHGARSFYYPATSQTCRDCHMPLVPSDDPAAKNGVIRSHRFAAANTALPFVNGDTVQLEAVQDFLRDGQVTLDVFGVVRTAATDRGREVASGAAEPQAASTFAVGEESLAFGARRVFIAPAAEVEGPLGAVPVCVEPGDSIRVDVVVRTRKVGHFFPAGTVDAFDVWVELDAVDATGREIFHSGALDDGAGEVDGGAHFYRSLLLDEHGNPINKRNAWAARTVAYVNLIPPGAADTVHYRLEIPEDVEGPISLTARLNYRKFAWWNTQWAYAGVRDPAQPDFALDDGHDDGQWVFTGDMSNVSGPLKAIPELPVTEMAHAEAVLQVVPEGDVLSDVTPFVESSVRERWNDYGIGLFRQGDLKGAEAAFAKVTEAEPEYVDGWVNLGRARVQEGNVGGAEEVLLTALALDPELARTRFFLALALKGQGRYDEALVHLEHAAKSYPLDRVVRNQIGRLLFLQRQFAEAVESFEQVLAIDPEDLTAHYNLMLSYRGLDEPELAARERQLYERFKADESAQAITGPYRQLNPDDNNERQPIHEHRGTPSADAGGLSDPGSSVVPSRTR